MDMDRDGWIPPAEHRRCQPYPALHYRLPQGGRDQVHAVGMLYYQEPPRSRELNLSLIQRRWLRELCRDPALKSRERDRVEMYLLSADGLTVPQLARHFNCCEATLRRWIRQFKAEGLQAVRHKQQGLGPNLVRCRAVRRVLNGSQGDPVSMTNWI